MTDNGFSFIHDFVEKDKRTPPPPSGPTVTYVGTPGGDTYANQALQNECAELSAMGHKSGRNGKLNEAAFNLGRFVRSGALTEQTVRDALTAACRANGLWDDPEDGPASINATIASGLGGAHTKNVSDVRTPLPDAIGDTTFAVDIDDSTQTVGQEGTNRIPTSNDDDGTTPTTATLEDIEDDFWTKRKYLTLIYDAAIARMASPWAVLACCMARALALVPPHIVLPPLVGGEGSLNWYAAISAKSGGGKGAAMAVAKALMPHDVNVRGIGSGEGMIEVYQRSDKDNAPPPVTSVLFSIEEIDSLGAMGGRSGQTTMAVIRHGFSGEKLGYSYRGRQGEVVAEHSYRMTVVASVQPERAGVLFEDAGGGTPQRFMWFPGRDKRITATPPAAPAGHLSVAGALIDEQAAADEIGGPNGERQFSTIGTPPELDQVVREARALSMNGDDDTLNSHALFCREKFAYGLAILDGETAIRASDWELSGTAAEVSDWCRDKAQEGYARGRQRQSREKGEMRAHENDERTITELAMSQSRVARIVNLIVKHLGKSGPMTETELYRKIHKRDRGGFGAAPQAAASDGLVVKSGDAWALP